MDTRTLVKLAAVSAYAAAGGALVVAAIVASIAGSAAFIPIGAAAFPMAITGYVTLKMMD